jgi:hypothetical protein
MSTIRTLLVYVTCLPYKVVRGGWAISLARSWAQVDVPRDAGRNRERAGRRSISAERLMINHQTTLVTVKPMLTHQLIKHTHACPCFNSRPMHGAGARSTAQAGAGRSMIELARTVDFERVDEPPNLIRPVSGMA